MPTTLFEKLIITKGKKKEVTPKKREQERIENQSTDEFKFLRLYVTFLPSFQAGLYENQDFFSPRCLK